jgi:ribosomal-protein-alanine N-acetyltransferase
MHGKNTSPSEPIVILTTPRLVLRTATENDIPLLHERIFTDQEVMRYAFAGLPMAREESERFMRAHFTFGNSLTGIAVLTEKSAGEVIGYAGLLACDALEEADFELGFVLARRAWGRGLATEIGRAQLAFGFGRISCNRLLGLVEPRNTPSIHVLEKLGMRYLRDIAKPARAHRRVYLIEAPQWRKPGSE